MHEMSLIQSLLDIIEEYSARDGFERVNSLKLSYGAMSSIDQSALEFGFSVLSKGSRAEHARLTTETLPIVIHCLRCEEDFECRTLPDACPRCSGCEIFLMAGTEELRLVEMDVD